MKIHRLIWVCSAAVSLSVIFTACVTEKAAQAVLYAPDFRYYEQTEIKDAMHRLANGVQAIDTALRAETRDEDTRTKVLEQLGEMEAAATELSLQGRIASNHPMFDRYLEDLRYRLASAKRAVEYTPPDYFLVGTITGACLSCHQTLRSSGAAVAEAGVGDGENEVAIAPDFAKRSNHGMSSEVK